jgi:hypothetical protein
MERMRRPHNDTRRPHNDTRRPHNDTRRPHNDTRRPHNDTRRPHNSRSTSITTRRNGRRHRLTRKVTTLMSRPGEERHERGR